MCNKQWKVLVPVGAKYEDLQQTGRRSGDREEIKVDKKKDKQTQRHSAKALKLEAASFWNIYRRVGQKDIVRFILKVGVK